MRVKVKKMKKVALILSSLFIFISCNEKKKETSSKDMPLEKKFIRLHVLDGGKIVVNNLELFSQDTTYHGQSKTFANAFYVIQHPKGNLIWDGGLPENLVGLNQPFTDKSGTFTVSRKDSLVNQLKSIGLTVNDFKYIALSHNHFDHIGHANYFKNAIWLVQENEYNFFKTKEVKKKHPELFEGVKNLTNPKLINGDFDVFGDGKVVIKYMPGHTIGHQVLYLDLGLENPILLTGDLYHFKENRAHKRVPVFNYDVDQTLKSMEGFEQFAKDKNAVVIIQHSPNDFNRLKKILKN